MCADVPSPLVLSREAAIARIRGELIRLTDDTHSMCQVAAERGILCRGFRRYTDEELAQRYAWLVQKRPGLTREELEDLGNRWQLARQIVNGVPLACDAQQIERDTCLGWDDFSDQDLTRWCHELLGLEVVIQ